jgi:site-specific recombinase XerD
LEPTDKLPKGKKPCLSLRKLEKQVDTDLDLLVNIVDGQMTVCELVDRYLKTKTGVRQSTKQGYVTVQRLLAKESFQVIIEDRNVPKVEKSIDGYSGFLFYDDNGMPLVAMHWQHRFNHMVGRYNDIYRVQMPNITPHVCRHTYCSNMAKLGMNPKTLQYLMGHSDISVTMNVYTHIGFDDAEEELKRMEAFRKAQSEVEQKKEKPMSQKMFKVV